MAFSQGKRFDSKATGQPAVSNAQIDGAQELDTKQMFRLIDSILSFEACLCHQILPLALEESRLKLGMVNPEDTAALDYVGRILSYMNLSLVSQPIDADAHRAMLSAYLNYTGTSKQATERVRTLAADDQAAEVAAKPVGEQTVEANPNDRPTLIVDYTEVRNIRSANQADSQIPLPPSVSTTPSVPTDTLQRNPRQKSNSQVAQALPPLAVSTSNSALPVLEVQAAHLSSSIEVLATLPPKNLLQELLGRVLAGGIGRLYFERQSPKLGRILWSQNGVVQSVLENLPLPVFQEVIDELKRLTHLPLSPVQEPKQVEIERLYEQNRLLLRLRVMPGAHGEQATLQVLRGAALKVYQHQQVTNLSRDALGIAQQLQRKLNELQERARLNPSLNAGQLKDLPALNQLLEKVDQQLKALTLESWLT